MANPFSLSEIDKIGNAVVYLAERIKPLSKTKLLKLISLIEEYSVKTYGLPFFNLDFTVWKLGPVSRDIFVDLSSDEPILLAKYIRTNIDVDASIDIFPKVEFSDDEFSDNEMKLLEHITTTFKDYSASELVQLTHRKHSLWYLTALEHGVLTYLEEDKMNSTEIPIDFSRLLDGMPVKKAIYEDQRDYLGKSQSLKN
ncbi:Panacea domain-containing protein [Dyadobacter subterraneus]|uniref:SocA family protein n=1 Tax=Dyadobacter subterraneus TaxID=2773304 RepID=A0ABR9WKQ5_9BACT|nr:Panacea domain-containing protein [Dyadobacter subterraneus]MBE9466022.1 SocA family protein [Dyadobacter subterraneus]